MASSVSPITPPFHIKLRLILEGDREVALQPCDCPCCNHDFEAPASQPVESSQSSDFRFNDSDEEAFDAAEDYEREISHGARGSGGGRRNKTPPKPANKRSPTSIRHVEARKFEEKEANKKDNQSMHKANAQTRVAKEASLNYSLWEEQRAMLKTRRQTSTDLAGGAGGAPPVRGAARSHRHISRDLSRALDTSTVSLLLSLQDREITPEDYDLLLRLDETVKPKTLDHKRLVVFPTEIVEESSDEILCTVCMDPLKVGDVVRKLPCGHAFHQDCIDAWLTQSSVNCPVDGLSLQ